MDSMTTRQKLRLHLLHKNTKSVPSQVSHINSVDKWTDERNDRRTTIGPSTGRALYN